MSEREYGSTWNQLSQSEKRTWAGYISAEVNDGPSTWGSMSAPDRSRWAEDIACLALKRPGGGRLDPRRTLEYLNSREAGRKSVGFTEEELRLLEATVDALVLEVRIRGITRALPFIRFTRRGRDRISPERVLDFYAARYSGGRKRPRFPPEMRDRLISFAQSHFRSSAGSRVLSWGTPPSSRLHAGGPPPAPVPSGPHVFLRVRARGEEYPPEDRPQTPLKRRMAVAAERYASAFRAMIRPNDIWVGPPRLRPPGRPLQKLEGDSRLHAMRVHACLVGVAKALGVWRWRLPQGDDYFGTAFDFFGAYLRPWILKGGSTSARRMVRLRSVQRWVRRCEQVGRRYALAHPELRPLFTRVVRTYITGEDSITNPDDLKHEIRERYGFDPSKDRKILTALVADVIAGGAATQEDLRAVVDGLESEFRRPEKRPSPSGPGPAVPA